MLRLTHACCLQSSQLAHCPETIHWRMVADRFEQELESYRRGENGTWGVVLPSALDDSGVEAADPRFARWWRLNRELADEARALLRDKHELQEQLAAATAAAAAGTAAGGTARVLFAPSPTKVQMELAQFREKQKHDEEVASLNREV